MKQVQFARANALASYKGKNIDDIAAVSPVGSTRDLVLTNTGSETCWACSSRDGIAHQLLWRIWPEKERDRGLRGKSRYDELCGIGLILITI